MQLADHHALGPVDDERAFFCHQRNSAEIDFLLFDIADVGNAGVFVSVVNHQPDRDTQGNFIRHAAVDALCHALFDFPEFVGHKFKRCVPAEILYRKHRFEHCLKPGVFPGFGQNVELQETAVGFPLHSDEIGNLDDLSYLTEISPYALNCHLRCPI